MVAHQSVKTRCGVRLSWESPTDGDIATAQALARIQFTLVLLTLQLHFISNFISLSPLELKVSSTCNGTAKGSACVFPFMYKGMVFTGCTTIESDDNRKWCGTKTGEVLSHGQWGYCECEKKGMQRPIN
jgi:hypothetical protein